MKYWILILIAAAVTLSCGPELTNKQKRDQQLAEDALVDEESCKPFRGIYEGTLFGYYGPQKIQVHLWPTTAPNERGEPTKTLAGSFMMQSKDSSGYLVMTTQLAFNYSKCDAASGRVTVQTSANLALEKLELNLSGNQLNGTLVTLRNPGSKRVELKRMDANAFQDEKLCAPFLGLYRGNLLNSEQPEKLDLKLYPIKVLAPGPSGGFIPTFMLGGEFRSSKGNLDFGFARCGNQEVELVDNSTLTPTTLTLKWGKEKVTGVLKSYGVVKSGTVELKKESSIKP